GVGVLVLRHVGEHGFELAQGEAKLYAFRGERKKIPSMIVQRDPKEVAAPTGVGEGLDAWTAEVATAM
ncbi:MAG: hypothetical protein ACP5SK_05155, partial [Thermoprotei archaeon]